MNQFNPDLIWDSMSLKSCSALWFGDCVLTDRLNRLERPSLEILPPSPIRNIAIGTTPTQNRILPKGVPDSFMKYQTINATVNSASDSKNAAITLFRNWLCT